MPITLRQIMVIAVLYSGIVGCQSGPRWGWWRLGRSGAPESSPIARSAGPALPSELAQQDEASLASGTMQTPSVESGGEAPPYETPGYSPPSSNLASGYSAGSTGYPTTGAPPAAGTFAESYPATAAGDPFAHASNAAGRAGQAAAVQNGYYDPNALAATTAPQSPSPPAASGADRYGHGQTEYGGSGLASAAAPESSAAPWSEHGSAGQGFAATGLQPRQQPAEVSPAPGAGYGGSYPSTPLATSSAGSTVQAPSAMDNAAPRYGDNDGGRYGTGGSDPTMQAAHLNVEDGTAPPYRTPAASPGGATHSSDVQVTQGSSQPYRPGGTGDYVGPGSDSYTSIASRQDSLQAAPAPSSIPPASTPSADGYNNVPQSSYGNGTGGRRY